MTTLVVGRRAGIPDLAGRGFAAAVMPVSPQTITTDTEGLAAEAGTVPVPGAEMPVYWARPEGNGPFPLLLVVHEIFGVHEHIQDVCRRFAKAGYFALAPELYFRQGDVSGLTDIQEIVGKVVSRVPDAGVMADLDAAAAWASATGFADPNRLGITGFCWGGRITWLYAAHNPRLRAGVAWYGRLVGQASELQPRHPIDLVGKIAAPILGLYGEADGGIPVSTVHDMEAAAKAAGKTVEFEVYPEAPHAFFADYRPSYRADAAQAAWAHCLEWLGRYL